MNAAKVMDDSASNNMGISIYSQMGVKVRIKHAPNKERQIQAQILKFSRDGFFKERSVSIIEFIYFSLLDGLGFAFFTTRCVRANKARTLGTTIRLLNISVSSQTKSEDTSEPNIIKPREIDI